MSNKNIFLKKIRSMTPERVIFLIPILSSILITFVILYLVRKPLFQKAFEQRNTIKVMNDKINRIPETKLKLKNITTKLNQVNEKNKNLLSITIGTNSFKTFLYEFGEIAQKNNLEVTKLTPLEILTSTNKNTSEKTIPGNIATNEKKEEMDPFLVKNSLKQIIDIELTGDYSNIISFIKESEELENLIIYKDFNFSSKKLDKEIQNLLKINLVVYGKNL